MASSRRSLTSCPALAKSAPEPRQSDPQTAAKRSRRCVETGRQARERGLQGLPESSRPADSTSLEADATTPACVAATGSTAGLSSPQGTERLAQRGRGHPNPIISLNSLKPVSHARDVWRFWRRSDEIPAIDSGLRNYARWLDFGELRRTMLGRHLRCAGKDRCHAGSKSCRWATCYCRGHGRNKSSRHRVRWLPLRKGWAKFCLRRSMLSSKAWRVPVKPIAPVIRLHASRLWPRCGAILVSSLPLGVSFPRCTDSNPHFDSKMQRFES
jgi:hypothetical protein